jgi:5-(carboxyamino)imidazole ribonucleotide mutase
MSKKNSDPVVAIIMGSKSDWPTMEIASQTLTGFGVPHESKMVSAHRTPDLLFEFANGADRPRNVYSQPNAKMKDQGPAR